MRVPRGYLKCPSSPTTLPRALAGLIRWATRSRQLFVQATDGSIRAFRKSIPPPSPPITEFRPRIYFWITLITTATRYFRNIPIQLNCPVTATSCTLPSGLAQFAQAGISSFSSNFKTPKVEQASLNVEKEVGERVAVGTSYMYVHGVDLIRARDVNLPPPVNVQYPVYDSSGVNFLGTYYDVQSFATWQMIPSFSCPWPPCINPLARPIPQLSATRRASF
jgi:hypothetical protein